MGNIPTEGVILIPRKDGAVLMQLHNVYVIVKCRPRGVCGIWSRKLEGAKRPSAEWSKSSQTPIGRHLSDIDPKTVH